MAYKDFEGLSLDGNASNSQTILNSDGHTVELPDATFIRDAEMIRDGMDLVLDGPNGTLVIKDYFAADSQPNLVAPDGSTLTPDLVNSFAHSPAQYAGNTTMTDESPVGAVQEVTGNATVTHLDGSTETITNGTLIYQGDVIETDAQGAVNIKFIDETSFAVSEDARLAIDEYVYDASTQSGETNFSVLKGVFVFTSGLIGRDDPDDVHIDTPVGSIGIRGTIIAGNVDTGEITVVEGAIVLKDHNGHEMTLATQFETARFHGNDGIEHVGQLSAADVAQKFYVVSQVSPTLFSSINDAAAEQGQDTTPVETAPEPVPEAPQTDGLNDTGEAPATQTAAVPPVPPPVAPQNVTGFTSATSGLGSRDTVVAHEPVNTTTTTQNTTTQTVANTTAAASTSNPLPVNDPRVTDGNSSGSGSGAGAGASNNAPHQVPEAAPAFFKSSESQTWQYHFDKEFRDDGGHSNLTYQLSANTVADLNSWVVGNGLDILTTGGWTFNATNGLLQLNFNNSFATVPGTVSTFDIEVQAVDAQGAVSGYYTYTFSAHNAHVATLPTNYAVDNQVVSTLTPANSQIDSDYSTIFLGDGNDTIIVNTGLNNNIYLGDGNNTAILQVGARHNWVVGGDGRDLFELQNAATNVHGMDGDDDFRLVLDGTSTVLGDLGTALGSVIDGGHSNFRAGLGLGLGHLPGETGGRGDSLVLQGAGTLNFSAIDPSNTIYSIERIDATSSLAAQTIVLNYNDILRITDDKNALIINLEGNDTLQLTGMTGMVRVHNDIAIDDGLQGTPQMRNYDVYTDGTVTLLISATGAAATNGVTMDGSNVAI